MLSFSSAERRPVTMNVDTVSNIRKTSRDLLTYRRRLQREEIISSPRNIETSSYQQNVVDIIEKLKTKSSISTLELKLLKNAIFENADYTETLLGVHGALRGLIREFTGTDIRRQCEAAASFCNMALGNNKACHTLAKTAGTYLVASLDNMSSELAVTSIWTIGNLSGSEVRTGEVLSAQGAISKLTDKLANTKAYDIREAVLYALEHFVYNMKHELSEDALQSIFEALKWTSEDTEFSRLLFLMSCHPKFPSLVLFNDNFFENLLKAYVNELEKQCKDDEQFEYPYFIYITRALANVCVSSTMCDKVLDYVIKNRISPNIFNLCNTQTDRVRNTQLWLLGNLFNFATDCDLKRNFFSIFF